MFVFTFIFAQSKATIGVKAGVTISGMQGDAVNNLKNLIDLTDGILKTSNRTGFFAGVYANLPMGSFISIEPGIFYTQKGYELKGGFGVKGISIANAKAQLQSEYIDVPLLLKVNFSRFQIFAGPQVSYLLNADLKTSAGLLGFNLLNNKMEMTSQFNPWDVGLTGGIGYQISKELSINASYDQGLSKINKDKTLESYNRSVKVGMGITF